MAPARDSISRDKSAAVHLMIASGEWRCKHSKCGTLSTYGCRINGNLVLIYWAFTCSTRRYIHSKSQPSDEDIHLACEDPKASFLPRGSNCKVTANGTHWGDGKCDTVLNNVRAAT